MIQIFIGYDYREPVAFHTCANSIIRHSSKPVSITPLALNLLPDFDGSITDGSNQFTYSRFLVPHLANYYGWGLYIDGDMIVTSDIAELWDMRHYNKDVMVVKHDYKTKQSVKYLGAPNQDYPRKNWSSVVLWNCASEANRILTPNFVNQATGAELHRFSWIEDDRIGELPVEWNWLADEFGPNPDAKLIHYTLGTPCFSDYTNTPMAEIWQDEFASTIYCGNK
jgi:lipopolysaccharide biosynthesis glycosyltransferase